MKQLTQLTMVRALALAASLWIGINNVQAQNGPGGGNFDPEQMRQNTLERMREQLEVKTDAEWKIISELIEKVMEARRAVGGGPGGPGGFGGPGGPGGPGGFRPPPGDGADRGPSGPGGFRPGDGGDRGPGGFGSRQGDGGERRPAGPGGLRPQQGDEGNRAPGGPGGFGPRPGNGGGRGPGGPGGFGGGPGGFNREPDIEAEALQKAIEANASGDEIKAGILKLRNSRKERQAKLEQAENNLRQALSARQEAIAVMMGILK